MRHVPHPSAGKAAHAPLPYELSTHDQQAPAAHHQPPHAPAPHHHDPVHGNDQHHGHGHHAHQAVARPVTFVPAHQSHGKFHPLPVIGHAEAFYERHAKDAEAAGDRHARASHKVGQYVTAALAAGLPWEEKLRRFTHALDRYCVPPHDADTSLQQFYGKLGDVVRRYAGQEALVLARKRHDEMMRRFKAGEPRETLEEEAEVFFFDLLGHGHCPDWCSQDAWKQIVQWRDFWI